MLKSYKRHQNSKEIIVIEIFCYFPFISINDQEVCEKRGLGD